jgi:hypothetical protein
LRERAQLHYPAASVASAAQKATISLALAVTEMRKSGRLPFGAFHVRAALPLVGCVGFLALRLYRRFSAPAVADGNRAEICVNRDMPKTAATSDQHWQVLTRLRATSERQLLGRT